MSTSSSTVISEAYDHCQAVTKREARNFYFAFITLPRARRRAIYATYAFARTADDIVDSESSQEVKALGIQALRSDLNAALSGNPNGPVLTALADAVNRYSIPPDLFAQLIDGVELDLHPRRYANFEELHGYCYRVASVVGLISISIFGYDDSRARDAAIDLGLAMQLTNIMRDVREDSEMGRVYLPVEDLDRFGYSEDELRRGVVNEPFVQLMRFEAKRARDYYRSGAELIRYLAPRSRACPAVLHGLYSKLLDRIEERGFDVFSERVRLSSTEKLRLTVKLWAFSFLPRFRT